MILRWTPLACADLAAILDYVLAENPGAASRLVDEIDRQLRRLVIHPGMGRPGRCAGTRELVISRTSYVAAYRVQGAEVQVLRVLHGARKWPQIL